MADYSGWASFKVYLRAPQAKKDYNTGRRFLIRVPALNLEFYLSSWSYQQLWWGTPCCGSTPTRYSYDPPGTRWCQKCHEPTTLLQNGWRNDRQESQAEVLENLIETYNPDIDILTCALAASALAQRMDELHREAALPRARKYPYKHSPEQFTETNVNLAHFYSRVPLGQALKPMKELQKAERKAKP